MSSLPFPHHAQANPSPQNKPTTTIHLTSSDSSVIESMLFPTTYPEREMATESMSSLESRTKSCPLTLAEQEQEQETTVPIPFPAVGAAPKYQYHVYGTGRPSMDWVSWLNLDDPDGVEVPAIFYDYSDDSDDDDDSTECGGCVLCEGRDGGDGEDEDEDEDMDADDETVCTERENSLECDGICSSGETTDCQDTPASSPRETEEPNTNTARDLMQTDVINLKISALGLLPAHSFLSLPQVKEYLAKLSRDEIMSLLCEHLHLDKVTATKNQVTTCTVTLTGLAWSNLPIIRPFFPKTREVRDLECDFMAEFQDLPIESLGQALTKMLCTKTTPEVFEILIEPRVESPVLELLEMYGSAAAMGEFGLHLEGWWQSLYQNMPNVAEDF
ncbi:hypothetical protein BDW62DRAFT_206659 [Aspergillus aurantiobrunneus]